MLTNAQKSQIEQDKMIPKEKHFIDSSPFISVIKMDGKKQLSIRYFARLRSGFYRGYISFSVYAEVIYIIKRDIKRTEWVSAMYGFLGLIDDNNINTVIPDIENLVRNLQILKNMEKRVGFTDTRLLADAISLKMPYFATLDTKMGKRIDDEAGRELIKIRNINKDLFVK
ncbi:MAG: PIN domain-containing protein [Candidatus Altiarchaeota archaeon]|nr:PIN domain-containing protein [Candidatus Altiarchaeota archaeon]